MKIINQPPYWIPKSKIEQWNYTLMMFRKLSESILNQNVQYFKMFKISLFYSPSPFLNGDQNVFLPLNNNNKK